MWRNYLKIALRTLSKYKGYTLINVLGLAIGLASSIFIGLYVVHELSYDKFHEQYDQIYRLNLEGKMGERNLNGAYSAAPVGPTFKDELPEVRNMVRIRERGNLVVKREDRKFVEEHFVYADSTFFNIFSFPLVKGNPEKVLSQPNSVVLTEETAQRYFGDENPVGQFISVNADTNIYEVTGICSNLPGNSHIQFDFVASLVTLDESRQTFWLNNSLATYITLEKGSNAADVEANIPALLKKYAEPQLQEFMGISFKELEASGNYYRLILQPLADIHFNMKYEGGLTPPTNPKYITIFAIIAVLILVIASINFMNLSTARSANRAREVGLRKVVGSGRKSLILQFLIEALVITFIAMAIAYGLVVLLLPGFNELFNLNITFNFVQHWFLIPVMIGVGIIVGLLSGSYPAFYLSSFQPVRVLKGKQASGAKSSWLRRSLVLVQFVISILILSGTIFLYQQLQFLQNKSLGFDKDHVLVIRRGHNVGNQFPAFKQELERLPQVDHVSTSWSVFGYPSNETGFMVEGKGSQTYIFTLNGVDYDFNDTYGLQMKRGRFFSRDFSSDSAAVVVNEELVRQAGFDDPIGKHLLQPGQEGVTRLKIIGVVEDFHFRSLHQEIGTYVFRLQPEERPAYHLNIKLSNGDPARAISGVKGVWQDFSSEPFAYSFFKDDYNNLYDQEQRTSRLVLIFSGLGIFIALLGVLGLIAFSASQRTKEIGIRKALGSSVQGVTFLISKEIIYLVLIASLFAWPIAYYAVFQWLENFAYRISVNPLVFFLTTFVVLAGSFIAVSSLAIGAARKNPAVSLRYEG